jgi:transposase
MSGNKQRRFTDEFKREAVRLTMTSGRSVERVANDLGIAKSTLSRWRSEHEQADLLEGPHEDVSKELARLRKENEILRQEREILKKAAASMQARLWRSTASTAGSLGTIGSGQA